MTDDSRHTMDTKINLYKFFDRFGIPAFAFIFLDSLYRFLSGDYSWDIYALMLIGLGGFYIDTFLVFFYKAKK